MKKEKIFLTNSYKDDEINLSELEKIHFEKRFESEEKFFNKHKIIYNKNIKNVIEINKQDLENGTLIKKLSNFKKFKFNNLRLS